MGGYVLVYAPDHRAGVGRFLGEVSRPGCFQQEQRKD
jgi:hypothetical protein